MSNTDNQNKYYVYAWYYIDSNQIFYIGKGCNNRWKDTVTHRNNYFKSIINKEKENVSVKKLYENLSEEDAWNLERKLIHEYWNKNQCKANFHEGGCGGNHSNYNDQMKEKLRNFAKTRVGAKNPMYHHIYTKEQLEHISNGSKGRKLTFTEDHKKNISIGLKKLYQTNKGKEIREQIKLKLKGQKRNEQQILNNKNAQCPNNFICKLNGNTLFETRYRKEIFKWIKENLGLSVEISQKILDKTWKPKFNKHKQFEHLEIIVELNKFKSVSTNPDECKEVE